jgi:hypothetical protein
LEHRNQIRRRRSGLDLHALDLLARDLLLDRLQEALPVLILVLLGVKLGLRQLADEPIARSWSADLGIGALVDLNPPRPDREGPGTRRRRECADSPSGLRGRPLADVARRGVARRVLIGVASALRRILLVRRNGGPSPLGVNPRLAR